MSVTHYRQLTVWQKSMMLAKETYSVSEAFPKHELYGITSQIRRAAISIPSNIAEGHNRDSTKEYLRFLAIAQGSVAELETQISLACMMGYIPEPKEQQILAMADEIGKMLRGLQKKLYSLVPSS